MNKILPIILVVMFSHNANSGWFFNGDFEDINAEDFKDRRVIPREEMPTCDLSEKLCYAAEVVCQRDAKACLFNEYPASSCVTMLFTSTSVGRPTQKHYCGIRKELSQIKSLYQSTIKSSRYYKNPKDRPPEPTLIEKTSSTISTTASTVGDAIMFPVKVVGYTALITGAIVTAPIWLNMGTTNSRTQKKKIDEINLDFLDTPSEILNKMNLPNEPYRPHETDIFDYDSGPKGMWDDTGGPDG